MQSSLESGLWMSALKALWESPDSEVRTALSAGWCCKAKSHDSICLFHAMFRFKFTISQFPETWIGVNTTTYYYLGNIWTNFFVAVLWSSYHYCDSMFVQNCMSKQPRPKFPWIAGGKMEKWKQMYLSRTALTFNNREIKVFSWV